ncbi:MAG: hypothetical protein QXR35_00825 [Candidatus Korarchaeum sp.]
MYTDMVVLAVRLAPSEGTAPVSKLLTYRDLYGFPRSSNRSPFRRPGQACSYVVQPRVRRTSCIRSFKLRLRLARILMLGRVTIAGGRVDEGLCTGY